MTLHKLTVGDGYTYLTRQVAAFDATERGHANLGEYYAQRGESPGNWLGQGLAAMTDFDPKQPVREDQMFALFGQGRHPDADRLHSAAVTAGASPSEAMRAGQLGTPFRRPTIDVEGLRARCAQRLKALMLARGSLAPADADERAAIRTAEALRMFEEAIGRRPANERELSGFIARACRPSTAAVAGYDLTYSPVKSVSALWALASPDVADAVLAAHQAAVADTLHWLEQRACFTRLGREGVRQVEAEGFIAAAFLHRDSRAGDPDLHTHVAISNKVRTPDGGWRALDGRVLFKAAVAASEHYDTRIEAELETRLGLRFAERAGIQEGRRPIREVDGMEPRLLAAWSTRRKAIESRRGELAASFQQTHGRPPTPVENLTLAQQANLETREAKHEPRSLAEQRAAWRKQALALLGGRRALDRMLDGVLGTRPPPPRQPASPEWLQEMAAQVLDSVSAQRATWQYWHIRAEAERLVRSSASAHDAESVEGIARIALSPAFSVPLELGDSIVEPSVLRRSNGDSMYTVAGSQLFTSQAVLDAETALTTAAGRRDGSRVPSDIVELALLETAANGVQLNPDQAQLVRELASSGARLQLAVAPAGAGKTTALASLARAWGANGGVVLGLAPSAVATAGLHEAIGTTCDTIAKLVWGLDNQRLPEWAQTVGPRCLVIVDEAGMAGTRDLARITDFVLGRGGVVRLVGDHQQLASVSAGGVLSQIAATHGAVSLSQLVRFADPAEAGATVAIREGDSLGLAFYLDRDRVHVGDLPTCADQAYRAWAADVARGQDTLLLAATREVVRELNERARADRLANTGASSGREVVLADGTRAGAGDSVITRANERSLPINAVQWVKNGDRWRIRTVERDGGLRVKHVGTGRLVLLPPSYVRQHVQLGYATTVHGAQGVTADSCHTVLTGNESRQILYVSLTRGRAANHLYLQSVGDGDPHSLVTPSAVMPPTATEQLMAMLARDDGQRSASEAVCSQSDPRPQLHDAAGRYADALRFAAERKLEAAAMERLEAIAEGVHHGLTDAEAWPTLRGHLALIALEGVDPEIALQQASAARSLEGARDPAAVLDWRLPIAGRSGPLPWLAGIPRALCDDFSWGPYLRARAAHVENCAQRVASRAASMTAAAAPVWARPLLREEGSVVLELAVWRAAFDIADADRRPTGPPRASDAEREHQDRLDEHAIGTSSRRQSVWLALADSLDPRLRRDPHWPVLAERLTAADRAGVDVASLAAAVALERHLPDDLPAAALWWRLAAHLSPAAVVVELEPSSLRPDWVRTLAGLLGDEQVAAVINAPAWPALVAAVTASARAGWSAGALLTSAVASLPDAAQRPSAGHELAEALVFRVAALTDPAPVLLPEPLPADLEPPDDADEVAPVEETEAIHLPENHAWVTRDPFGQPSNDGDDDRLLEQHFWATAVVPRSRLIQLNDMAAAFFEDRYPASWAATYLPERLATESSLLATFSPGFAPEGWTTLRDHLRALGATDEELLSAGLVSGTGSGRLIDRFRDRVVFPIHDADGVIRGFIGRRNPAAPEDGRTGPKYLNTPGTDLYRKGEHLFGLHSARDHLAEGATPAIAEGPLDALAITLAGAGDVVGLASLGTALTERQADLIRPHALHADGDVLVATDSDEAGHRSAERAFWLLAARGAAPRRLLLPSGSDPAEVLRNDGAKALHALTRAAPSSAHELIQDLLSSDRPPAQMVREAADIIGALPPAQWLRHIELLTAEAGMEATTVHAAVLDAGHGWTTDPLGRAQDRLQQLAFGSSRLVASTAPRGHNEPVSARGGVATPSR